MRAIFTTVVWVDVADIDEASQMVMEMDESARFSILARLEQRGAEVEDLEGHMGYLGTSFWLIDEERVMG